MTHRPLPPDRADSIDIREEKGGLNIPVVVLPRASANRIVGIHDRALKIRITAPPVEGAANAAVIAFLAETLAVPKGMIEIVQGKSSRRKRIRVSGLDIKGLLSTLKL